MTRRGIRRFLQLPRSAQRIRADIDEELRFDIDMRTRDLMRAGVPEADARGRAVQEFGDVEATRRYCEALDLQAAADARRSDLLNDLRGDLLIAWRAMRRAPAFAVVVLVTLALGIGANTTVFSVVRRVLIAPLPYRAPDELYRLYTTPSAVDGDDDKLSAVVIDALAHDSHTLSAVTMFGNTGGGTYTDAQTAEVWKTAQVALNFFDVFGVRPVLGRTFVQDDVAPGAPRVMMLTHALWQRAFGGDTRVIGRHIKLSEVDYLVVGVLRASFVGPTFDADALSPLPFAAILQRSQSPRMVQSRSWRALVRVRPGVTDAALQADLASFRMSMQARYPDLKNVGVVRPVPLRAAMVGNARAILILVMSAASLVLVIACVNIAGLFLSRATAKRRELGVRAALGAGRARLIRQVLTESAMYGVLGGVAGIALSVVLMRMLLAIAGSTLPHVGEIRIDAAALAFAAVISIGCGLAFGLLPAIAATRVDLRDALGDGGIRAASQGRGGVRGSRVLVATQLAFAVVLLVGAGLLMRTFVSLTHTPLGYGVDANTLAFRVNLPYARYRDTTTRGALVSSLVSRIHGMPNVQSVGYTSGAPWSGGIMNEGFRVEGRTTDGAAPSVQYSTASDEYFSAIGIALRAGRVFTPADRKGAPLTMVVSESVARRFWPNESPIGAYARLGSGAPDDNSPPYEIIGVVADVRARVLTDIVSVVYVSERQWPGYGGEFVVRTGSDPKALVPAIKNIVHDLDPNLPVISPRTLREVLRESIARQTMAMALMAAFAALAVLLAALGVYSVMAYGVASRTREFGIRTALGAERRSIVALVLRQGLSTAGVGVAIGLVVAATASGYAATLLVGVSPHDVPTFVAAAAVLAVVAVLACFIPARAATRVQPVEALRGE
jgi:putative ABC transport system permease protein